MKKVERKMFFPTQTFPFRTPEKILTTTNKNITIFCCVRKSKENKVYSFEDKYFSILFPKRKSHFLPGKKSWKLCTCFSGVTDRLNTIPNEEDYDAGALSSVSVISVSAHAFVIGSGGGGKSDLKVNAT